jgi:hypothetical protein
LLNGSKNWTIKRRNTRRITAAGIKYVRKTAGYAWTDHKRHRHCKRINITPGLNKIQENRRKCL